MYKPKTHNEGINMVREWVSQHGLILPYVTGRFLTMDGKRVVNVGRKGMGDTVSCLKNDGRFAAIEVKVADGDRQKKKQEDAQRAIEANNGIYLIADFRRGRDGVADLQEQLQSLGAI